MSSTRSERAKIWLSRHALPLWLEHGVDGPEGGFFEALTLDGKPELIARRALVQARQIYSFKIGADLGLCERSRAEAAVQSGLHSLLMHFSLPIGAFVHSLTPDRKPANARPELYTQAFALFGMAQAYAPRPTPELKERALRTVAYLETERRATNGGFTELSADGKLYQSNPHMHLFEALLAWMEIDSDPIWRRLADETMNLCLEKFIDPETGYLAEFFDAGWKPLRENSRFVWEPGHQFEWSWLMGWYQRLTHRDLSAIRRKLFDNGERLGISKLGAAYDQMWSDGTPKLRTSRFWPQCERIKAACQLNEGAAADQAMDVLFRFLETPHQGLWYDTCEEDGRMKPQSAKASSLYHIIGALSEYLTFRG